MSFSSEHNTPWDAIASAFGGNSTSEEKLQLEQWISTSDENKQLFNTLKWMWTEDPADFSAYHAADENVAWDALFSKMKIDGSSENREAKVIGGNFGSTRTAVMRWASVAAVLTLMVGSFIWYNSKHQGTVYETGIAQERSIGLADGSSITLYANSKVVVNNDYNESERVVTFERGAAFFEVTHNEKVPFRVDMQKATVKDIGTSFYINNSKDSVRITVKTGEVAFTEIKSNETRQLFAGMSLMYIPAGKNSRGSISVDSTEAIAGKNLLHFLETPLSEVIPRFEKQYGKKLILQDSSLLQKPFTANLEGLEFDEAINILGKSLNINYSIEKGVYYLK